MEIQRNLTELHPRKGILNIDVLSFQRLALRVLEDLGADRRRILEETGKNLVIRRAAMEHRKELTLLGGSMEKNGYISQVKSMISELAQYRIEPETMDGILESLKDQPRLYYKWKDIGILYHAFQEQMAKEYVKMGFYIGIGGVVTFKNAKKVKETVAEIPLTSIVLETDCPYLAPEPFRGKRNQSAYIQYVAEKIAEIKEISYEEVVAQTEKNARAMYGLDA